MEPYTIDISRLANDIKGFVAKLKTIYFESKEPIDDNELVLQKLCVRLEIALRHGMKDKYTFLGVRKDYWNFFSECLPKDEGVRYVNSISQLNTVQGKGRAWIRYCLVQKTLADTIQRALMHKRKTEWFSPDALLLNASVSNAFISKLYDLNELEFHLSCTGCDLDMSWPAFGRSFTDGFERRKRRNSNSSVASTTDFANERTDPLIALNAEVSAIKQMVAKEFDKEKTGDVIEENSDSNDEVNLNISDVTLELSRVHQLILKWKSCMDSKLYKVECETQRLAEENDRISRDLNSQLELQSEKHENLSKLASKESALEVTDLKNKLKVAEDAVRKHKTDIESVNYKLSEVTTNYEKCLENVTGMREQLTITQMKLEEFGKESSSLKETLETEKKEQVDIKETCNNLKSKLNESESSVLSLRKELEESETKLRIKHLEQSKLQEAFENVNGLVFSSFEDFESYYKTQLQDKEKGLEVKNSENISLERRVNHLNDENNQLKERLKETQEKFALTQNELELGVAKQREKAEHFSEVNTRFQKLVKTLERTYRILSEYRQSDESLGDEDLESGNSNDTFSDDSIELQCRSLINDLNKTKLQLKVYEENLEKATNERAAVQIGSENLSSEVERLLKQNKYLENEKTELCLGREEDQKRRSELENQIRVVEDEKIKLEESMRCVVDEKSKLNTELKTLNEKLQQESYSRLVNENELSETVDELTKEKEEKTSLTIQLDKLKSELIEKCEELDKKVAELTECKHELSTVTASFNAISSELETMEEKIQVVAAEKHECEEKVVVYQEKLASLQCTMDQEVSSLKFQLSSEVMKYDDEIKELSKERDEAVGMKEKIQESEDAILGLENKLKERNEEWQSEKKKLISEIKILKNDIKVLNANIDADKKEIQSMESTLLLSKKQCEKVKGRNDEYKRAMKEMKHQKSERENILEQEKMELEEDMIQLKNKLVSVLSDKSELWKRSNQLEFDMKTRLSETWVEDKDVMHCPKCNVVFSLFVRKHHCRFCGNVFCHACSDNFVKTIHSRKPYRCCDECYEKEKELRSDTSLTLNTSQIEHSQRNMSTSSFGSDSETDSSFGKASVSSSSITVSPATDKITTREYESKQRNNDVKTAQVLSDDSNDDDNYEVIEGPGDSLDLLLMDSSNVKTEIQVDENSQGWNEAAIPAGKRYLISTNVITGSHLVIEFTTSSQSVLFGVVFKEKELMKAETALPFCQVNSDQKYLKRLPQVARSGVVTFVFDNTRSKSTVNKLSFKVYLIGKT